MLHDGKLAATRGAACSHAREQVQLREGANRPTDEPQEFTQVFLITCYDRNGEIVKRVTSADEGNVEDGEENESSLTPDPSPQGEGSENGSGNSGGVDQN